MAAGAADPLDGDWSRGGAGVDGSGGSPGGWALFWGLVIVLTS